MHFGLDDEEYALLQQVIRHYAAALHAERGKTADLQRRLDCANERLRVLEAVHYGAV